mmetsp:Transcript_29747/g.41467  ORF Transcript_29747/g.41467 Transcript_29747/m.41467 type:complete len:140 (+) Transcript_29747:83-502(+)
MPFVILRYDNKYRFFTLEAPVPLVRKLAKNLRKISFQMKLDNETRVTGDMARTGLTLRNVMDAIESEGWDLTQASTGGHTPGSMGNELYVFSKPRSPSLKKNNENVSAEDEKSAAAEALSSPPMLMPPPPKKKTKVRKE